MVQGKNKGTKSRQSLDGDRDKELAAKKIEREKSADGVRKQGQSSKEETSGNSVSQQL